MKIMFPIIQLATSTLSVTNVVVTTQLMLYIYYFIWKSARYTSHFAIYYNTRFKRYMHINGMCLSQVEPAVPNLPAIQLGIAATDFPLIIRVKLRLIKEIVSYSLSKKIINVQQKLTLFCGSINNYQNSFISLFVLTEHVISQFHRKQTRINV